MRDEDLKSARLLVVDDDAAAVRLLEHILTRAGYREICTTTDALRVVPLFTEFRPDLIVLDLHMPGPNGFELLENLQLLIPEGSYLPILMVTGDLSPWSRQRALSTGAKDFLTKPFEPPEVLLRIRNLLETRFMHLQLLRQNERLEEAVQQRTRELDDARIEILERLAKAAEYRDDDTRRHTERVGEYSARFARRLGLAEEQVQLIRQAAPLHDLGKIGIPDEILLKPGELTPTELAIMRTHTIIGAQILSGSRVPTLQMAEKIALCHHERWDGTGYPNGLKGERIPLCARIVAVADFFDALAHDRPYRRAWPTYEIIAEIRRQAGHQFDPHVAAEFLAMIEHEDAVALVG